MDPVTELAAEIQTLRGLCNLSVPREERLKLLESIGPRDFVDPEHQVVFESVLALLSRGEVTAARLAVHLNNRGFPDTDIEKYFQSADNSRTPQASSGPESL